MRLCGARVLVLVHTSAGPVPYFFTDLRGVVDVLLRWIDSACVRPGQLAVFELRGRRWQPATNHTARG